MQTIVLNACLMLLSTVSVLGLAEGALRFLNPFEDRPTVAELDSNELPPKDHDALLGEILRKSEEKSLIYELKPNLDTRFLHARLRTNEEGFKGDLCTNPKRDTEVRILGIGDSLMFGWGIPDGKEYLALLKQSLQSEIRNSD